MAADRDATARAHRAPSAVAQDAAPAYIFGLEVSGLAGLPASLDRPAVGCSRAVRIHVLGATEIAACWKAVAPRRLSERRLPDGRLVVAVDEDPGVAYRIEAPAFGVHLVSADGSEVLVPEPDCPDWYWQRLLFSQTLSIAAAVQGMGLFHASAVRVGDFAVGIAAPSGTGKTSTAAHLVAQGAEFFTDDVLALDLVGDRLTAFAGPEFFSIEEHEARAVAPERRERLGPMLGESIKQYFRPSVSQTSLPLGLFYLLERDPEADAVHVDPFDRLSVGAVLASGFVPQIRPEHRLVAHLELCGRMATGERIHRVRVPPRGSAAAVAAVLMEDIERRLARLV